MINRLTRQQPTGTASQRAYRWSQWISWGPISPPAIENFSQLAKFTDYFTRLKAVYLISKKSNSLSIVAGQLCSRHRLPVGASPRPPTLGQRGRVCERRFSRLQQFSSSHTPQQNGIPERDGRTIMNMTRRRSCFGSAAVDGATQTMGILVEK